MSMAGLGLLLLLLLQILLAGCPRYAVPRGGRPVLPFGGEAAVQPQIAYPRPRRAERGRDFFGRRVLVHDRWRDGRDRRDRRRARVAHEVAAVRRRGLDGLRRVRARREWRAADDGR